MKYKPQDEFKYKGRILKVIHIIRNRGYYCKIGCCQRLMMTEEQLDGLERILKVDSNALLQ